MLRQRSEQIELQERLLLKEEEKDHLKDAHQQNDFSTKAEFSVSQELPPVVTVHAGKVGCKGFVDGVLCSEARFSSPIGVAVVDDAVFVTDSGIPLFCVLWFLHLLRRKGILVLIAVNSGRQPLHPKDCRRHCGDHLRLG